MNLFGVIRAAPPEYSLILIVSSHEIKLAFFGTVPLRIHYSAHGGKNVIEETGERCNENSSWRGLHSTAYTFEAPAFLPQVTRRDPGHTDDPFGRTLNCSPVTFARFLMQRVRQFFPNKIPPYTPLRAHRYAPTCTVVLRMRARATSVRSHDSWRILSKVSILVIGCKAKQSEHRRVINRGGTELEEIFLLPQ